MGIIDRLSGPSPILGGPPNSRRPWVRFSLGTSPAITDTWGVSAVAQTDTGVFTVTLKHAYPKGIFLCGQSAQLVASSYGFAKLTSWDANNQVATVEFYTAASGAAPALSNASSSVFLVLEFQAIER